MNIKSLVCALLFVSLSLADDDVSNKKEWKKVAKKICCKDDIPEKALSCIDGCYKMTPLNVKGKFPHEKCRETIFKVKSPTNEARKDICHLDEKKNEWRKCIKKETDDCKELKEKYKNNEDALEKLLNEKFDCFEMCTKPVKC